MTGQHLPHDWFSSPLPENVVIGKNSWLYSSFAFRHYYSSRPVGVSIGNDTGVYNPTFFILGVNGELTIGNYCTLVSVIFCTDQRIEIGNFVFIAHEVVMADRFAAIPFTNEGEKKIDQNDCETGRSDTTIIVGNDVWIGARAILLSGAKIGEGAIVGAGAVVDFSVPAYSVVAGNPARIVKTLKVNKNI